MRNFLITLVFVLSIPFISFNYAFSGGVPLTLSSTDNTQWSGTSAGITLFYVFDLRDRETFIQFTYEGVTPFRNNEPPLSLQELAGRAHVQIFDVSNNCNENNFFDVYTANDTHDYNMRDIVTNDGNPS